MYSLNKLDGIKSASIKNICRIKLAISYAENLFKCLFSKHKLCKLLNLGPWFARKKLNKKKRRILISERMKYIIHKSGSVPLLPLLVLTRTIYYVIHLLYHGVECIKPTMDHVSNQYNWKYITSYILYGKKRFKSFLEIFSCVNRFEKYGNKPLGFLRNPFSNTRCSKTRKLNIKIV